MATLATLETLAYDIPWYNGVYKITKAWEVISMNYNHTWKPRLLVPNIDNAWYIRYWLVLNWKQKWILAHRLVAMTFIPNIENKSQVNHINWIKDDNRVENLEWCTASENNKHKFKLWYKNMFHGENNPSMWKFWSKSYTCKKVSQFDMDWNYIKEWWSVIEAAIMLCIQKSGISGCCRWKIKSSGWFIWKY